MADHELQENWPPSLVGPNDKYYRLRDVLEEVFHVMNNSSPDESIIYHEEDFEELELLGEGVSSYVQKVRRKSDNQLFAMKVIHLDYDSEAKNAVISGMKILKQINSPYVIKYSDCYIDYGNLSVLLEYMDSGSLRDKINEKLETQPTIPVIPYNEIRHIAKSVLSGLLYLHQLNIIHRDIKADNILLNQNNDVKISDFGCSTTFNVNDDLLDDQHGTIIYMSPELIKGTGHNYKTDIFSFGLMIYECVTGKFIFHYLSDEEIGYWGLYNRYESVDPFIDVEFPCSDECADFIKKCLIVNFEERWDAAQLLEHPFLKSYE